MNADGKKFEIIVVHGDNSESQHRKSYPDDAPWLALPFDSKKNEELNRGNEEGYVPCFQIWGFHGKRVVDGRKSRADLGMEPKALLEKWIAAKDDL